VPAVAIDDVLQTALIVLIRRWPDLSRPPGGYKGAAAYATKVAVRFWRRQAKIARRREEALRDYAAHHVGASPSPEDQAYAREMLTLWLTFAPSLPDEVSAAIATCALEGLSHKEAAERLAVPIGTLDSRIRRARRDFEDWMKQLCGPGRLE
jgi:RNA polymerase sigma-70 factor (ECF subfamily)